MHNAYVASDVLPAIAFWLVALLAAIPAFSLMRHRKRGRARSAIAYLAGLFLGLMLTIVMAIVAAAVLAIDSPIFSAGAAAAFLGPFTGIVHAKLRRPARRRVKFAEA
ncbi:MAG TPA: hypothetical protein VKF35_15635 [Hyphomicrobiaceae bacterium]|nr:hypothetical protein [Hyphomicrobiaceae bacterium]